MLWIAVLAGVVVIVLFLYFRFRASRKIENNIAF